MSSKAWQKANQDKMRKYRRDWYDRNKEKQLAKQKPRQIEQAKIFKQYIAEYLKLHPCVKCGEDDIVVLEFDHINPETKRFTICESFKKTTSLKTLQIEIDKCQILCANCHRRKTAEQFGYYKYVNHAGVPERPPNP